MYMEKEKIKTSDTELYPDNKLISFSRLLITVLLLIFMGILTVTSFTGTTGMQKIEEDSVVDTVLFHIREGWETVIYYSDGIIGNVMWLAVSIILIFLLLPLMKKIPLWAELIFTAAWTIGLGMIWIYTSNSAPSEDSYWVTTAAWDFAKNNFSLFSEDNRYFRNYSFQLGYVFFNEIIIRIAMLFGEIQNLLFLEMGNVILLAACYIGIILINTRIFKDDRIRHVTVLLFMFAAQPIIFCSFLYGIIPGITFAIYGVFFMVMYMQKNKFIYGILSALFIAIAVMIKSNNNIVLVAVCCTVFVMMFSRKKYIKDLLYIVITVVLSVSITPTVKSHYEHRANVDLGDSIPYTAWFVMGLNEADNAPGWYSPQYTVNLFSENNFDADAANKKAIERIKSRVKYFADNPQYRHEFFYKKFISQWNETSYQSIWNNMIRPNYKPRISIAEWVCTTGEAKTKQYMDYYAQLIFMAFLFGLSACLKNKNFLSVIFPLIILGGMMYHLLAEAKSQYSMPYFILMIGFAAYGICVAYDFFEKKTRSNKIASLIFYPRHKLEKKEI